MTTITGTLGIVGGTGQLGSAIAEGLLRAGAIAPEALWISSRSGARGVLPDWPGVRFTTENAKLAETCDTILVSVPPAHAGAIDMAAPEALVVSVMAGVSLDRLGDLTGAARRVRAMSSPAAAQGRAYSAWLPAADLSEADRAQVAALFGALGAADEVAEEHFLDHFTAMTGPVPGFVAFFAQCVAEHAVAQGIPAPIADRAVRQLFLAAGEMMAEGEATPGDHVTAMIDYAGTTAAGLEVMRDGPIKKAVSQGLSAAAAKAREMG